jgi:hypothetical protein
MMAKGQSFSLPQSSLLAQTAMNDFPLRNAAYWRPPFHDELALARAYRRGKKLLVPQTPARKHPPLRWIVAVQPHAFAPLIGLHGPAYGRKCAKGRWLGLTTRSSFGLPIRWIRMCDE